MIIIEANIK